MAPGARPGARGCMCPSEWYNSSVGHFSVEIDTDRLPVLLIRWEGAPDESGSLDAFLDELLAVWRKADDLGRPLSIVVDASNAAPLSAPLRQHQADWLAKHRALMQRIVLSVHVCIRNPLVRGALTAIRWISSDLETVRAHARVDGALAAALADVEAAVPGHRSGPPAPEAR